MNFKSNVKITATAENIPEGCMPVMLINGKEVRQGTNAEVSYTVPKAEKDIRYCIKVVDAEGNITKGNSNNYLYNECRITVNTGFFAKLLAFFRSIFGLFPTVEVKP